jgi:hypothetical protein
LTFSVFLMAAGAAIAAASAVSVADVSALVWRRELEFQAKLSAV